MQEPRTKRPPEPADQRRILRDQKKELKQEKQRLLRVAHGDHPDRPGGPSLEANRPPAFDLDYQQSVHPGQTAVWRQRQARRVLQEHLHYREGRRAGQAICAGGDYKIVENCS